MTSWWELCVGGEVGALLARLGDADNPQLGSMTPDEQRIAFENRTATRLTDLLERSLGFGKVRVSVSADLDLERIETNEEIFNPEGQVVRSTQTIEDSSQSQDAGPDAVSVGQNLPDSQQLCWLPPRFLPWKPWAPCPFTHGRTETGIGRFVGFQT